MARIIVGVMGDAYGHLSQALALAELAPQHEYLFLGAGTVREVVKMGFSFLEVPLPATFYANNKVDIAATLRNGSKILLGKNLSVRRIITQIERFSPCLAITAYEYFTSIIAKELGITCISLDNHHFLTKLRFETPRGQMLSRFLYALPLKLMFSKADHYFISSFYQFPPRDPKTTDVFPPVLRKDLRDVRPADGGHVLVYQSSPTFSKLIPELEKSGNRYTVYGYGEKPGTRNIVFRPPSRIGLLRDLATCRYVISSGGHNLISEALFLGKPVFSYPIHMAYEQFFNARMLRELNYGDYTLETVPRISCLARFEEKLTEYRGNIGKGDFCGNEQIAAKLKEKLGEVEIESKTEAMPT
ncbi:MAG: glycosyltransferase family protein [Syntrophobacteraceae bacterium]